MAGCADFAATAQRWQSRTGIPASVFLAIIQSESNCGAAPSWFGIQGDGPLLNTWEWVNGQRVETQSHFVQYSSQEQGFAHFWDFINGSRYSSCVTQFQSDNNANGLVQCLNSRTYATDPQWANKIANARSQFAQYDTPGGNTAQGLPFLPSIPNPIDLLPHPSLPGLPSLPSLPTPGDIAGKAVSFMERGAILFIGAILVLMGIWVIMGGTPQNTIQLIEKGAAAA